MSLNASIPLGSSILLQSTMHDKPVKCVKKYIITILMLKKNKAIDAF